MFAHTAHAGNELSDCDRAVAPRVAAMARKEKCMVDGWKDAQLWEMARHGKI